MPANQPLFLIKDGAASKAGAYSSGAVLYRLLTDSDRSDLYFAITGNQGGSGYFSREVVPFTQVRLCVADAQPGVALPSKTFRGAFIGRSTNNPGFLSAILRAEGLLSPAPDNAHQHLISGDWDAWYAEQLALPAEPLPESAPGNAPPPAVQPVADASEADATQQHKGKKSRKGQASRQSSGEEGGDAGAA
jgi:hypothetical protein